EESVALSGTLTGEDGNPLNNTIVQIDSKQIRTRTNASGFFKLNNVPFGEHTLNIIDSKGRVMESMPLVLVKGNETRLEGNVLTVEGNTIFNLELKDGLKITDVERAPAVIPPGAQSSGRTVPLIGALLLAAVTMLIGGVVSYFVLMARQVA
ncbi:MAG: peptidase associated/transthyretin-like domain-containing protein, partial [Saccharofermentanales bacterium]